MPRYTEFNNCCALVEWWSFYARINKIPEALFFHVPNQSAGGARHGRNLKRMGVRAGTLDYFLAIPRGGFHGAFVEMKSADGRLSPEQKIALANFSGQGYQCVTCYSTDQARQFIETYLKL